MLTNQAGPRLSNEKPPAQKAGLNTRGFLTYLYNQNVMFLSNDETKHPKPLKPVLNSDTKTKKSIVVTYLMCFSTRTKKWFHH